MRSDRRSSRRESIRCRVDYADTTGRAWMGLIHDVSLGGIYVDYAPEVAPGEDIMVAFMLPQGPALKLRAEVVRRQGQGAGLRFKGLSERSVSNYPESLETYWAVLFTAWMGTKASLSRAVDRLQPSEDAIPFPQSAN